MWELWQAVIALKMDTVTIVEGTILNATTASGERVRMRALGAPIKGRDFPVVWVCTEEEYERSQANGGHADSIPWPLSAVEVPELV